MLMMMCQLHTTKDIKLHIESYSYVNYFSGEKITFTDLSFSIPCTQNS